MSSKKQPWYKRMIPTCGRTKESLVTPQNDVSNAYPAKAISVHCGLCRKPNSILPSNSAFVCSECRRVNRVFPPDNNGYRRVSVVSESATVNGEGKVRLTRTASTTFLAAENIIVDAASLPKNEAGEPVVPQCTVCMDGAGDMVLEPCCHGGICEPCAKHICKNLSVGGAHCPKCRTGISRILRLCELYPDGRATGVPVEVPVEQVKAGPPRVPPPPGHNKAKQG